MHIFSLDSPLTHSLNRIVCRQREAFQFSFFLFKNELCFVHERDPERISFPSSLVGGMFSRPLLCMQIRLFLHELRRFGEAFLFFSPPWTLMSFEWSLLINRQPSSSSLSFLASDCSTRFGSIYPIVANYRWLGPDNTKASLAIMSIPSCAPHLQLAPYKCVRARSRVSEQTHALARHQPLAPVLIIVASLGVLFHLDQM